MPGSRDIAEMGGVEVGSQVPLQQLRGMDIGKCAWYNDSSKNIS
jgi:hypothetical protein